MKINLNNKTAIDLDILIESRLLVQANSGGGKSWAIRRIIEQAFGHVQIIVIDPEGEFGNLRSTYDFVYAGKGGDAPVESRSASLLARRLLELKASAIIDLYELPPHERKHFVRLFCEAMVNAPKELWHDTLVIIDEAHVFAPEKGESEAMGPVIDLATRGRKRGYCVVLATQRLPKLNKDAAAECNNKLIGRASQDIDRKRASEELGFTTKEQILSLRDLNPGEFYTFGPAISRDVVKTTIGDVHVKPPKRGVMRGGVPAPSDKVKQILSKLADLPQEAQEEAKSVAELKQQVKTLTQQLRTQEPKGIVQKDIPMGVPQWREYGKKFGYWEFFEKDINKFKDALYRKMLKTHGHADEALRQLGEEISELRKEATKGVVKDLFVAPPIWITPKTFEKMELKVNVNLPMEETKMGEGERKILIALAQYEDGMTREHLTIVTGYKRSTRDAYIQRLLQKGYIESNRDGYEQSKIFPTTLGIEALGSDYKPLLTGSDLIRHYLTTLPEGEAKILEYLLDAHKMNFETTREHISEATGFKRSTRDAYIQRLRVRGLVKIEGNTVKITDYLI